jgi:DNA-directed RNA polymerase subunit D
MIPLTTDLDSYKLPQDCECGGFGCPLCQVSLTCEVINTTNTPLKVYSGDLKSNDPQITPVDSRIPIVKIDKNNQLILEAYASLGKSKEHVKWQAVSNIFYRFYPEIEYDNSKCAKCIDKCIVARMCPEKLYDFSDGKVPKLLEDYWKSCTLCKSCEMDCLEEAIKVRFKDNTFIFSIESDGVLPFNVILKKTFEIFLEKIDEFVEKLEVLELES